MNNQRNNTDKTTTKIQQQPTTQIANETKIRGRKINNDVEVGTTDISTKKIKKNKKI